MIGRPDPDRYIKDAPPRVFDVHVHFPGAGPSGGTDFSSDTMVDFLAYTARVLNIWKIGLLGRPGEGNDLALRARDRYPELFLPMAWVRLDEDTGETIHDFRRKGFVGLKFHSSNYDYDDERYYPIYQAAEETHLICLFHTGIAGGMVDWLQFPPRVARTPNERELERRNHRRGGTHSATHLRPGLLDTIAQAFPDLRIIGAHLGYGYYDEACAIARWRDNISFDISGGAVVRRHIVERRLIKQEIHPRKLMFGSDSGIPHMSRELTGWMNEFEKLGLTADEQDQIFYRTAAEIFGIE
jgi:predicted TIM-barrel fold metal-dependent hydrolase